MQEHEFVKKYGRLPNPKLPLRKKPTQCFESADWADWRQMTQNPNEPSQELKKKLIQDPFNLDWWNETKPEICNGTLVLLEETVLYLNMNEKWNLIQDLLPERTDWTARFWTQMWQRSLARDHALDFIKAGNFPFHTMIQVLQGTSYHDLLELFLDFITIPEPLSRTIPNLLKGPFKNISCLMTILNHPKVRGHVPEADIFDRLLGNSSLQIQRVFIPTRPNDAELWHALLGLPPHQVDLNALYLPDSSLFFPLVKVILCFGGDEILDKTRDSATPTPKPKDSLGHERLDFPLEIWKSWRRVLLIWPGWTCYLPPDVIGYLIHIIAQTTPLTEQLITRLQAMTQS